MKHKLLSILLCLAMALSLLPTAALADETTGAGTIKVGEETYSSFSEAVNAATPDDGVITYEISGKVEVNSTEAWIQVLRDGLSNVTAVKFVGAENSNAEICIKNPTSVLADQKYDIDVSFEDLKLSHPNGAWVNDLGHATNYFACVLRNPDAANNTVTYTNCTFPNGVCNNQHGNTVFDNCKFTNVTSGKYNLWNYGGNTEIKSSEFTGTRGIKAYSEGADGGDITVADTTFTNLTEKAAIVASKPVGIVVEDISVSGGKGFITRDITGNDEVELNVSGTGISGTFYVTSNTDAEAAKSEFNITAGTFIGTLDTDYLAPGATINESGTVEMNPVAKVGDTGYTTLDDAITNAQDGDTITILKAADESGYTLNGSLTYSDKAITIKAASGVDVKFDMSTGVALHGAEITFEGVTFEYKTNNDYVGLQHTDTMVYNNCVFKGQMFLYGASETFNGCTFLQDSADAYNVWTYGAKEVEFNDCTFNCAGKSVLVFNEGANPGTDLTVTNTIFRASTPAEGKAAIEIDTHLMKGQTKITVDRATAGKITGFGTGSNSGSSLWNDKNQTVETNKNTTVVVAGKTVFEPTCIDLDTFIKMVEDSNYNFDGTRGNGSKLTVKWSPESGCFDLNGGHHQLGEDCPKIAATGNTPNRWQDPYAQYQLFASATDLSISNVNFVYVPAKVSVCMNGSWGGKDVTPTLAELQLNNSGDTSFAGCTFDKVTVSPYGKGNNNGNTNEQNIASFTGCKFANVTDKYAIKDVYAGNVTVKNCTFNNCGGGIYLEGGAKKGTIDISDNNFTNIGAKGLIQFSANGDYTNADIILDGNTATNCGPTLRQLNQGIADYDVLKNNLTGDLTGLGGVLTYTKDSKMKEGKYPPAQPTVYTVKFENADVAEMKVIKGTKITLPTPGNRPNYKFEGWYDGNTKVGSPYTVSGDVTLVAQWLYIDQGGGSSSSSGDYSISVDADKHGTVTVSPKRADKGDTVTITVKPNKGYELGTLTVTDKNGKTVKVTSKGNDKYTFTMPDSKVTVEATFVKIDAGSVLDDFTDVNPNAWYAEAVEFVVEEGLMTGTSSTTFAPDTSMSRAMIWTVLAAYNSYNTSGGNPWYAPGQQWAMVNGVSDGTSPNGSITREQLAVMLWRAAGSPETSKSLSGYADASSVSDWAVEALAWAVDNGIISGMGGDSLAPQTTATRAQVAVMLMQFVDYMEG